MSEIPTFRHGKNTKVYFSSSDLSTYFNSASVSNAIDMGDTTTFGAGAKTYVAGLSDSKASLGGLWDGTALAVDDILSTALAVEDRVFTYMPEGGVLGRACYLGIVDASSYEVTSPIADVVSISAELQADGGLFRGVILAADTNVTTATTTNNTNVDNTVLTSNGGIATLHVTGNSNAGSTTFKVQHSVDNSVWVDLGTFTVVTTGVKTAERIVVAAGTTVNRHLRCQATTAGAGSITYSMAFARR